jgi:hypothetical protein
MNGRTSVLIAEPSREVTPVDMDKKKAVDDTEPGPAPRAVDRFSFIKPEQSNNSPK